MKILINTFIIGISFFLLTACNSSTFSEKLSVYDSNVSFGGVVVDGYISGATVCLDGNTNGICEASEPRTISDEYGQFSFNSNYFVGYDFIQIIASGGIDTATDKAFRGELKSIINTDELSQENSLIVNPLTDLVAVSFFRSTIQDNVTLENSITEVADVFNISAEEVLDDPMLSTVLFVKVQEIQHLKRLIQTAADKSYIVSSGKDLPNEIKEAIVTQIKDSVDGYLNLDRVLDTVEIQLNITIPQIEKTFISAQVAEIKRALDEFILDTSIELENLDRLQLALENELETAYTRLESDNDGTPIEIVSINITYSFITQSDYDRTGAVVDEQACLATNGYQTIEDSSFSPSRAEDTENALTIKSNFGLSESMDLNSSDVVLYYTDFTASKTDQDTIVYGDDYNYHFSFDNAWTQSLNNTIYIRTPQATNTLYSCYRVELNTTVASEVVLTKVYRFLDI